jgi:hypothetical protein
MGDRCYSAIRTKQEYVAYFEDLGYTVQAEDGGIVELDQEEANYGNYTELVDEAKGIVFICNNGAGDCYGECAIVSDGKQTEHAEMMYDSLDPAVEVDDNGKVKRPQLVEARKFIKLRKRVAKLLDKEVV